MDVDLERRALRLFDRLLDQSPQDPGRWLRDATDGDAALLTAVTQLIEADRLSASLPTIPPSGPLLDEPPPPPERLGNYRIIEEIGRGGMGVVYLADRADGLYEQRVALKLIRHHVTGRAAAAFEEERRLLAQIEHPNVARLIDGGVAADGRPWLATEYVAGEAIDAGIADRALATNVRLVRQAAEAVQFVHSRLIAHGDVKPANILVGDGMRVKLLDFGVATLIGDEGRSGTKPLTPAFASPERTAGAPASVADDVFALGRTLAASSRSRLRVVTAASVRPSANTSSATDAGAPASVADDVFALGRTLAAVTTLSRDRELAAIIARATAPLPKRYLSAQALIAELDRWLDRLPVTAMDGGVGYQARKFVRRHLLGVVATGLALIGLGSAAAIAERNYQRAQEARAAEARRFADAHRTAHYMMFTLVDQLERQPGTLRLRAQIGDVAQIYLDRLAASPNAPREIQLEVVEGYLRAAATAGMGNAPNLGDVGRAQRDLARAGALLATLRREQPGWAALANPLAREHSLLCQNQLYGSSHDAGQALQKARDGLAAIAAVTPDSTLRATAGWQLRICAGDALVWLDRAPEAVALLENEARLGRARRPLDQAMLERNLRILGEAYYYAHRLPDAERVLQEAAAIQVAAHARQPFYSAAVIEAANVADDLASTYEQEHRYADQLRVAQGALDLVQAQAARDADDLQSIRRALSMMRLVANALAHLGRPAEGIEMMDRADSGWLALTQRFPDDATVARMRLMALRVTGDLQRRAGQPAAACATSLAVARGWAAYARHWDIPPSDRRENVIPADKDAAACGLVRG